MKIELREYTIPRECCEVFNHNFNAINRIEKDALFDRFCFLLSVNSGIDKEIVLIDLKHYLMVWQQYRPDLVKYKFFNYFIFFRLLFFVFKGFVSKERINKINADIIIDDWDPVVLSGFYGAEFLEKVKNRHSCLITDLQSIKYIDVRSFIKHIFAFWGCFMLYPRILREHKIDIRFYLYNFLRDYLVGLTIKKTYSPKLFITGNDNGFPVILAKSAGTKLLCMQNGLRGLTSDASFRFSDYYISMGSKKQLGIRLKTGNVFKKIYFFGSLRLYNFLNNNSDKKGTNAAYDILWISNWSLNPPPARVFDIYYPVAAEIEAIRLLNKFSLESNYRIAYQCRYEDEIDILKQKGLFSERIMYFDIRNKSAYEAVLESRISLSTGSTLSLEALALDKKIGIINLSENELLAANFRDLNVEYNSRTNSEFKDFIYKIYNQNNSYKKDDYILQNNNFVNDLTEIINQVIK